MILRFTECFRICDTNTNPHELNVIWQKPVNCYSSLLYRYKLYCLRFEKKTITNRKPSQKPIKQYTNSKQTNKDLQKIEMESGGVRIP